MDEIEVVVAHSERATLRVGDVFLKVDTDPAHAAVEIRGMQLAPVPTPPVLWHRPPVLAIARVPGRALGVLGEPSPATAGAWHAAGRVIRRLHEAPLPPGTMRPVAELRAELDRECDWLLKTAVIPADMVHRNRAIAEQALRPVAPAFIHGDLQITHVFVDGDEVTGIIDWSEAAPGDPMMDLAVLTLGHEERLEDLLAGYDADGREPADRTAIRAWWSLRSLTAARWLLEHGFDPDAPGCEFDVLRARMDDPAP